MKSILDRSFRYVPAAQTDISKTFAKWHRQQKELAEQQQKNSEEAAAKVEPLKRKTA